MIKHIVEYQNHYCFSFLFEDKLIRLINKGILVSRLLESNIFSYTFEYESWPAIHSDNSTLMVPYNGSKFELIKKYHDVFPDLKDT